MAITDRRGVTLDAANPASTTIPNPGLGIKAPVRAATIGANITLSGLPTLDGVALASGDRVLVKDQTDPTKNGIYNVAAGAWTFAVDFAQSFLLTQGLMAEVAAGSINAGTLWQLSLPAGAITPGSSALTFVSATAPICIEFLCDGGGALLQVPFILQAEVPAHCTVQRWTLLADAVGSVTVDLWNGPYSALPLSAASSIAGDAKPSFVNAQYAQGKPDTTWTTGLAAGSILAASIISVGGLQRLTLSVYGTRP